MVNSTMWKALFPAVLLVWWMKEEHLGPLRGIQSIEFNDKCVILMSHWETTSRKCSEKISETHIPSGCRINYKNIPNYIHTLPSIFCFPQRVLILTFLPELVILWWSNVISWVLMYMVVALKFLFSQSSWCGLAGVITKRLRSFCVFPLYVLHRHCMFYSTYKLSGDDSQTPHKYAYQASGTSYTQYDQKP